MRRARLVAALLALVLAVTGVEVAPAQAQPRRGGHPAAAVAGTPSSDGSSRQDPVSAQQLARRVGHRVEVIAGGQSPR